MALSEKDFPIKIDTGLRSNKEATKFMYAFKQGDTRKRGVIDYTDKTVWDKTTRKNKAKEALLKFKSKRIDTVVGFKDSDTLNKISEVYFNTAVSKTEWTNSLNDIYNLYCKDGIGKKRIRDIRKVHIDNLIREMETRGHSKQTVNGCSPRTIKKVIIQTLKPMFNYILENKVLDDIPTIKYKAPKAKKKNVKDSEVKLVALYRGIFTLYKDNPFYRGLFLFALYGRRWNEIRTLRWENIDFLKNEYTIIAEYNKIKEDQTYALPQQIADTLQEIEDNQSGLVFKSPVTGKELYTPKKQLAKLKECTNMPELTMHYFRHIESTAVGGTGYVSDATLSASLGHTSLATVNIHYKSAEHKKSSLIINEVIEKIINEN